MDAAVELNPDGLHYPATVRRRSPNCFTALVEASARSEFGIPSISKAWFSHSFVHERPGARVELMDDHRTLCMLFASDLRAESALPAKLLRYFGIELHEESFDKFDAVLDVIHESLRAGKLLISPFGACYIKDSLDYGRDYARLGHLISPVRLDVARGKLMAIDNMCGSLEVSLEAYAACFAAHQELRVPFKLMQCRRAVTARELPLTAHELRLELEACLFHLYSNKPGEGLGALRAGISDIVDAAERYRVPLQVHRLWSFSHDRSALEESLEHWTAARIATAAQLGTLGALLRKSAASWHGLFALLQTEAHAWNDETLADVRAVAQGLLTVEDQTATQLREIYECLSLQMNGTLSSAGGVRPADPRFEHAREHPPVLRDEVFAGSQKR